MKKFLIYDVSEFVDKGICVTYAEDAIAALKQFKKESKRKDLTIRKISGNSAEAYNYDTRESYIAILKV